MIVPIGAPQPTTEPRGVCILGSTGSIGTQTLDVIEYLAPAFDVVALAASTNTALLSEQANRHKPRLVVCGTSNGEGLSVPDVCRTLVGAEGLIAAATHPDVDIVVVASSGHSAIEPTIEAIKMGKTIALANKETLVCAADLILPLARKHGAPIHPVDSEHSAIWQSLDSGKSPIQRLILTASGGPFRSWPLYDIASASVEDALGHPTWAMGAKITIDSATMMNKGLEVIEAHHIFGVPYERIEVVIHPESIVHSMVEFADASQIAQLSWPDMRLPIQYALTYPHHLESPCRPLNLSEAGSLTFHDVEHARYPALELARRCGIYGETYPTVLSAADEVAVAAFLSRRINFGDIVPLVSAVVDRHDASPVTDLDTILDADAWSRSEAERLIAGRRL